jgi:hypothetical protein
MKKIAALCLGFALVSMLLGGCDAMTRSLANHQTNADAQDSWRPQGEGGWQSDRVPPQDTP